MEIQESCLEARFKDGDKVVIIEDVTTSGKSIEETFPDHPGTGKGRARQDLWYL